MSVVFQSSPSGNAGCYLVAQGVGRGDIRFNPHPAVMLGATSEESVEKPVYRFQSSPSGNAGATTKLLLYII